MRRSASQQRKANRKALILTLCCLCLLPIFATGCATKYVPVVHVATPDPANYAPLDIPKPKGKPGEAITARELARENNDLWLFVGILCAQRAAIGAEVEGMLNKFKAQALNTGD